MSTDEARARGPAVSKATPPPEGLSGRSRAIWTAEVKARSRSAGRLALLEECLRALDQADRFRGLLATQELLTTTTTTGSVHLNPLVKAEKEARAAFAQMAKTLNLEWCGDGSST